MYVKRMSNNCTQVCVFPHLKRITLQKNGLKAAPLSIDVEPPALKTLVALRIHIYTQPNPQGPSPLMSQSPEVKQMLTILPSTSQ